MEEIAEIIDLVIDNPEAKEAAVQKVKVLCDKYPLYKYM
jgi:glycine/serine hydroxymethyltransferase